MTIRLWFTCLLFALAARFGAAQQTVFNVPSGDVLDRGKVYFELDAAYRPSSSAKSFTPRLVFGVGGRVEVGVNFIGIAAPGPSHTNLAPTIKWKGYDGEKNGWTFLLGNGVFIPMQNRTYSAGSWTYAEISKTWNTKTRLTAGPYYTSPNVFDRAQRCGGQFALEQAVGKRFILAADWFTGKHAAGYLTPGVIAKVSSRITLYLSYQIGNSQLSDGNHQVLAEFGWNLN
jgi:hypothetical protein